MPLCKCTNNSTAECLIHRRENDDPDRLFVRDLFWSCPGDLTAARQEDDRLRRLIEWADRRNGAQSN